MKQLKKLITKLLHKDSKKPAFTFEPEPDDNSEFIDISNMVDVFYNSVYGFNWQDENDSLFSDL